MTLLDSASFPIDLTWELILFPSGSLCHPQASHRPGGLQALSDGCSACEEVNDQAATIITKILFSCRGLEQITTVLESHSSTTVISWTFILCFISLELCYTKGSTLHESREETLLPCWSWFNMLSFPKPSWPSRQPVFCQRRTHILKTAVCWLLAELCYKAEVFFFLIILP